MQSINHTGLCVKCDNVGLLGAIGYSRIYLDNLDFKEQILCGAWNLIFIGSATMIQGNDWPKLISLLLLFIELDKILLRIYVICVIDCTVIKISIAHTTCIGLKVFCIFACVCYCVLNVCIVRHYGLLDAPRAHRCAQMRPSICSWGHRCPHLREFQIFTECNNDSHYIAIK